MPRETASIIRSRLKEIGLEAAMNEEARRFHITLDEVLGGARNARATKARRSMVACLRLRFSFSYPDIGRVLGIDHSTAIYAMRAWEDEQ